MIQSQNDGRVLERKSRDLVEHLRDESKDVDHLLFDDEGDGVMKFQKRVRCYETITHFFSEHIGER